jgi:hypothetical protein
LEHVGFDRKEQIFVVGPVEARETTPEYEPEVERNTSSKSVSLPPIITHATLLALRMESSTSSDSVPISEPHAAFNQALITAGSPGVEPMPLHIHSINQEWHVDQSIGFAPLVESAKASFHRHASSNSSVTEIPRLRKAYTTNHRRPSIVNSTVNRRITRLSIAGDVAPLTSRRAISLSELQQNDILAQLDTEQFHQTIGGHAIAASVIDQLAPEGLQSLPEYQENSKDSMLKSSMQSTFGDFIPMSKAE